MNITLKQQHEYIDATVNRVRNGLITKDQGSSRINLMALAQPLTQDKALEALSIITEMVIQP